MVLIALILSLWFDLFVAAFAVWEWVEVWHHGSIFATCRARVENWQGFIGQVLRCPFCLSVWAAACACFFIGIGSWLQIVQDRYWLGLLIKAPVYIGAVARLANTLSDRHRAYDRTPKTPESLEELVGEKPKPDLASVENCTMALPNVTVKVAQKQGRLAHNLGYTLDRNPYSLHEAAAVYWSDGWRRSVSVSVLRVPLCTDPATKETDTLSITYLPDVNETEAERQGEWAYSFGHEVDANPYPRDTTASLWWSNGWKDARNNDEG